MVRIAVHDSDDAAGAAAAADAASAIGDALTRTGRCRLVAATGTSQLALLARLVEAELDWSRVELFHLDEYVGLPPGHPASFARYLRDRLVEPAGIVHAHLLDGRADPLEQCRAVGHALRAAPVDLALLGIGVNGHLAFNDPPADVATEEPYLVVDLDETCRRQQVDEGWFATLEDVPARAISMSINQILRSRRIVGVVTGARKAAAMHACFSDGVSPGAPASYLQRHGHATLHADREAVALLAAGEGS